MTGIAVLNTAQIYNGAAILETAGISYSAIENIVKLASNQEKFGGTNAADCVCILKNNSLLTKDNITKLQNIAETQPGLLLTLANDFFHPKQVTQDIFDHFLEENSLRSTYRS